MIQSSRAMLAPYRQERTGRLTIGVWLAPLKLVKLGSSVSVEDIKRRHDAIYSPAARLARMQEEGIVETTGGGYRKRNLTDRLESLYTGHSEEHVQEFC